MSKLTGLTQVTLTPQGRKTVEDMRGSGPQFAVLAQLYDSGGMTIDQLQAAIKSTQSRTIAHVKVLSREGYVTVRKMASFGLGLGKEAEL